MMTLGQRWRTLKAAVTGRVGVTPGAVLNRFAGALHSRLTKGWSAYQQAADDALLYNIGILRARARQLVEDNGEAAGLLHDFESDIVGPVGAKLQMRAAKQRGTPLEALNDRIEAVFAQWSKHCTVDRKHSFASLQRLMMRTVIVDGEFFALKMRGQGFANGYTLHPFDADLVDDTYNVAPNADGVAVVMGVEIDRYGRPLFYHVWERHPNSAHKGVRRPIPADDVVHVFKQVRVGQTRGVTWFAPSLVTWKLGEQYTESELIQSMLAAAQGGFFVNKDGTASGSFETRTIVNADGSKSQVPIDMTVEPGVSRVIPPGWEWVAVQPTHPTANYGGFMKTVKRVLARAFSRSYATLTGDLTEVNFSSMRTDRVRETEQNKLHQSDLLVRQFADVVFRDWLVSADLTGSLGMLLPRAIDELLAYATWMCRGWPWIDPMKDALAAQLEIQMRINSPQRVCAERGRDFYDVCDECADAETYAKGKGLTMDAILLAVTVNVASDDAEQNGDSATNTKHRPRLIA